LACKVRERPEKSSTLLALAFLKGWSMHKERGPHKGHHHSGKSSERFLDKEIILKELDIFPGQTILDAGCGNGYMSREFSRILKNTGKIYALDPDENALVVLKNDVGHTNITPILGDITKPTELEEASIDLIYLSTVLHGFSKSQVDGFRNEINRLLKPNGILAIVEIKKEPTPFGPPLEMRFSPQDLKEMFTLVPKKTIDIGQFFYLQLFEKKK
jgi:ubiquinone/menaquinone biosynthesis C-methylase UbiE